MEGRNIAGRLSNDGVQYSNIRLSSFSYLAGMGGQVCRRRNRCVWMLDPKGGERAMPMPLEYFEIG